MPSEPPSARSALGSNGPIDDLLRDLDERLRNIVDGTVASYIPELARADPESFAVSLTTIDGHTYSAGDAELAFTIQSVSKPFVYALALADRGLDYVVERVGVEPTGDPFNSITVDEVTGRPFNPMVNAGAIVTASLVSGDDRAAQFERIHRGLSTFAGRELEIDERVYASERATGDRNRAIGVFDAHGRCARTPTSMRRSTCISGSARSSSPRATCRSWRRPWPTAGSIR